MRKIIWVCMIIVSLFMFVSCSEQDNSNENQAESEISIASQVWDGHEESPARSFDKVLPSQAWEGYEELQGKSFGNVFTLPEKIRPVKADEAYSFYTENDHNEDQQANSEKYFKLLFGNDYDEKYISDQGEAKIYSDGDNGKYYAMYLYGPGTMVMNGIRPLSSIDSGYELKTRYDPERDKDTVLEVGNESITVGKLCENAVGFCTAKFDGHSNEFELYPAVLLYYHDADHDYYSASVTIGLKYKGIPGEYHFTPLYSDEDRGFYHVTTHYCPMMFTLDMYGSDDFRALMVYCTDIMIHGEKLDEIIPLKEAASILEQELAQNSKYKFERVELLYCAKNKSINANIEPGMSEEDLARANERAAADYGKVPPRTYVPTWVFTVTANSINGTMEKYIKVNAVTGEITIDA